MRTATVLDDRNGSVPRIDGLENGSLKPMEDRTESAPTTPLELRPPRRPLPPDVYAEAARIAGRLNAASISDEEYKSLLDERQRLLDRKFESTLSKQELSRLEYVRWQLDRIEDARHGFILDVLESQLTQYEVLADELRWLRAKLPVHPRDEQ